MRISLARRLAAELVICIIALVSCAQSQAAPPAQFTASITNGASVVSVDFVYHPIRGAGFQVLTQDAAGTLNPVAAPEARTYIGSVTGYPGATACALLQPDGTVWEYVIFEAGNQWWADNGTVTRTYGSTTFTPTWPTAAVVTPAQAATVTSVVAGDVVADIPYNNFTNTHLGSVDHAVYVTEFCLMEANLIYLRDIGFLHRIGRVVIRATQATDPYRTGDGLQTLRGQDSPFTGHECLKFLAVPGFGGGAAYVGTVGDAWSGVSINDTDGRGDAFIYWRHEVGHNHGAGDQIGWYCENYTLMNANQVGRMSGPEEAAMIASRHGGPLYGGDVMESLGTYPVFNLPPRASLDLGYAEPGIPVTLDVMANDHDSNGDAFSLLSFDPLSAHGAAITRSAGTGPGGRDQIIYTGSNTFTAGMDNFQYHIQDAHGSQALGNVYVKVAIANGDLAAYWTLDDTTGTAATNDAGTAGATLYNGASWATGTINGCVSFNGVNQYAKAYVDTPETDYAVSLWFRTSQSGGGIYSVTSDSGSHDRHIYLNGGNICARIWSEETITSTGKNLADAQWHQVVHTFGGTAGGQKLYVDGVLVASGSKSQSDFTSQTAVQLGFSASSPTNYFNGQIDDVRIWRRALGAAEALALAQRSGTANVPNPPTATIIGGQSLTLDWLAPTGATSHNIYLGNYSDVRDGTTASPEFKGNFPVKPFISESTSPGFYYWRVDERRNTTVFKGPVWYLQYLGAAGTGAINLTQATNWWVGASDSFTQTGVISGSGPLAKSGPGTLILDGDNTFTGGLTINTGTLQIGSGGTTGTPGAGSITNNSTVAFHRSDAFTFAGTLNGSGNVIQNGPGALTLSGGNITYTGNTIVSGGNLTLTATTGFNSPIQITTGQFSTNSTGNNVLLQKPVTGTGPLQVTGNSAYWTYMTADSSYTGGTVINSGGMLRLGNNTTAGSVTGDITDNGNLGLHHSNAWTFSNNVSGTGTLNLYSPGGNPVTVSGNTITLASLTGNQNPGGILANTTVNLTGTLNLATNSTLTISGGANVSAAGGMTQGGNAYNGSMSYLRVTGGSLTMGGPINDGWDGAYTVVQTGGTVTTPGITGGNGGGTWPTDTYTLEGGTLVVGANGIWGPYYKWPWFSGSGGVTMVLNLSGGTLAASASWSTSIAANLTNTTGALTVNPNGFTITMNGALTGSGGLAVGGSGTLTLTGANSYSGTTTVGQGTLSLGSATADAPGALVINNTGTVTGGSAASNSFDGFTSVTVNAGGLLKSNGKYSALHNLTLAGGTLANSAAPDATYGSWGFSAAESIHVSGGGTSVISANQIGTRDGGSLTVNVEAGSTLNVTGTLIKNPGYADFGLLVGGTGGTIVMSGANTFTGNTDVNAGTLRMTSAGSWKSATSTISAGATMELKTAGNTNLQPNTNYTGAGILKKTGTGWLGNNNQPVHFYLSAGGVIDTQEGDWNLGGLKQELLANLASLNIASGATFHISDPAWQVDGLTGAGKINNAYNITTPTLTIGVSNTTNTPACCITNNTAAFSGSIGYAENYNTVNVGTMNVVKTGTGTQVLSGTNGYTGTTTVGGGTLVIDGSLAAGSAVTVAAGAILGGHGTINGPVTVAGTIAPGNSVGTLHTGTAVLMGTYACEISGATSDTLAVTGNLTITGATLDIRTLAPPTAPSYAIASYTGTLTGTFAATGMPAGYALSYATPGQVRMVNGYSAWTAGFNLTGSDALMAADPDHDGIANGIEFVIGGNPAAVNNASLLPVATRVTADLGHGSQDYLEFTFRVTQESIDASVITDCQYTADPTKNAWTAAVNATNGVVAATTPNGYATGIHKVNVWLPVTLAPAGRLFARLHAVLP